jgi:hypothetical protein
MRIAQVAPLYESVPPTVYGGTERVVSYLTEELVRMGHDVTLFASGDSVTAARLVSACPKALWRDPECRETLPQHVRQLGQVVAELYCFDVVHFHTDYLQFNFLPDQRRPNLTTLHGSLRMPDVDGLFADFPKVGLVSISESQRKPLKMAEHRTPWDTRGPSFFQSLTWQLPCIPGTYVARKAA